MKQSTTKKVQFHVIWFYLSLLYPQKVHDGRSFKLRGHVLLEIKEFRTLRKFSICDV